jgi:hypothetical protein
MSYTGTHAQTALGTAIAINTGTVSTPVWTTIGEITAAPQSGRQAKTADTTNLQSLAAEFIPTLVESGMFDCTTNRVSSDAGQVAVEAAFASLKLTMFKITLPLNVSQTTAGDTLAFLALVEESNTLGEVGPDKAILYKFKLKISGLVTLTAGS